MTISELRRKIERHQKVLILPTDEELLEALLEALVHRVDSFPEWEDSLVEAVAEGLSWRPDR